jgi:hypothetical protein
VIQDNSHCTVLAIDATMHGPLQEDPASTSGKVPEHGSTPQSQSTQRGVEKLPPPIFIVLFLLFAVYILFSQTQQPNLQTQSVENISPTPPLSRITKDLPPTQHSDSTMAATEQT